MNSSKYRREFNSQLIDFICDCYRKFNPIVDLPIKDYFTKLMKNKRGRESIKQLLNYWLRSKYVPELDKGKIYNALDLMNILYSNTD